MILPLAALSFVMHVLVVLWVLVALALILIVLVQKGKGGGLASAFGGSGASSLLGTKTGDFLTWLTIALVALFLTLAVIMGKFMQGTKPEGLAAPVSQEQTAPPQPQTSQDSTAPAAAGPAETAENQQPLPPAQPMPQSAPAPADQPAAQP